MIHFLTPEYPPRHGGVADYTHQIATELSRGGETVHVWGPAGSAAQPGSAIVVHPDLGSFRAADLRRMSALLDAYASPRRLVVQWVPHGYGQRAMNLPFCLWLWQRSVAGDSIELVVHEPFVTFSGGIRQCVCRRGAARDDADPDERGAARVGDDARVDAAARAVSGRARYRRFSGCRFPAAFRPPTPLPWTK